MKPAFHPERCSGARPAMDDIDRSLLEILQQNATLSIAQMAERVGLSPTPCGAVGIADRTGSLLTAPDELLRDLDAGDRQTLPRRSSIVMRPRRSGSQLTPRWRGRDSEKARQAFPEIWSPSSSTRTNDVSGFAMAASVLSRAARRIG